MNPVSSVSSLNSVDAEACAALSAALSGEVVLPGDEAYESVRHVFSRKGEPAAVVRCRDTEDVRGAVLFAREQRLEVSVRSGKHSLAGFGTCRGGIVIDLSPMNGMELVDADRHRVRVAPGAVWSEVAEFLAGHGLAFSSGDTASVGVGGLLLGGGIGWMARADGLALDNMTGAEVVTADGRILWASAEEHSELFWALRGGGGNFGIVTSFEITARPLERVRYGKVVYPGAEAPAVLKGWARHMRQAPDELMSHVTLFPTRGGTPAPITVIFCYAGEGGAEAIDPLLALGTVESKNVDLVPAPKVLAPSGGLPPGWEPTVRSRFVPDCDDEFIDAALGGAGTFDTLFLEFRSLGGALNRVPADATAFAHRDCEVLMNTINMGTREANEAAAPALARFWESLAPHVRGAYSNFLSEAGEEDIAAAYPSATYARLQAVKQAYDPGNLFSRNPNVKPIAGS
ncbi:FAD-binding oxidoreductase [Streptomyces sp. NPDC046465]|uniref:FAD-binding oxidoreductase n=1 Tax=Streptomyces sp. NPDC046465 TaxID=3155810 RepID=UPI003406F905